MRAKLACKEQAVESERGELVLLIRKDGAWWNELEALFCILQRDYTRLQYLAGRAELSREHFRTQNAGDKLPEATGKTPILVSLTTYIKIEKILALWQS